MKTIAIIAVFITGALSSFAQGTVNFANSTPTRVILQTGPGTTTFVPVGSQFTAELMFAPDGTPDNAFDLVAIRVGRIATFGPLPGIFAGGTATAPVDPPGAFGLFQVRVWETAGGADYRSAVATGDPNIRAGTSAILRVDTHDVYPPDTPASLVASGLTSFTVTAVPEPSTIALAILGACVALIWRRTKRKSNLLLSALVWATALSAHGQGIVTFANSSSTRVFVETAPGVTTYVPVGNQFRAELMFAPDGTPGDQFDAVAVRLGATTTFGPIGGLFNGGGRTALDITPEGGFGLFQVRAWENAGGTDYRSAVATGDPTIRAGTSAILRVDTLAFGDGGPVGTPDPTLIRAGLTSFTLTPVPEPSIVAIALLAVGAWLILRRSAKRLGVLRNEKSGNKD